MSLEDNLATVLDEKPAPKVAAKKRPRVRKKKNNGVTIRIDRARFAQELIKNSMNATEAYMAVAPNASRKSAASAGYMLIRESETLDILTPLLEGLFIDAGIEAEYVFRRWLEIASGSAMDYFTIDESGHPVLDMSAMTPAMHRNLKSLTISQTQHGTNYKIETYDAQKAIDTIGKHLGLLVDKLADEDVERIGDMIERGVKRIKSTKDLDGWKDVILDVEAVEVK